VPPSSAAIIASALETITMIVANELYHNVSLVLLCTIYNIVFSTIILGFTMLEEIVFAIFKLAFTRPLSQPLVEPNVKRTDPLAP
jgi:hypothetical protein